VWCADAAEPGRVWVYERWADTPSFAAHLAGPWYSQMLAVLGRHGLRGASVAKYRVDKTEPVYDATGKPRADFFTD
jgi:quinol monooxygenase YgiN